MLQRTSNKVKSTSILKTFSTITIIFSFIKINAEQTSRLANSFKIVNLRY